ncbi:MAG: small-conductance mechanosensitive channel [Gammaproteobacteria bacterium]|jgi:small-conductance mechanosensitive channel
MMNFELLKVKIENIFVLALKWASGTDFYLQCGLIVLSIIVAYILAFALKRYSTIFNQRPKKGSLLRLRRNIFNLGDLIFPLFSIIALSMVTNLSENLVQQNWLLRIAVTLAIILMLYILLTRFIEKNYIKAFVKWILIPIAVLQAFDALDDVISYLDSIFVQVGNIRFSAYAMSRLFVFGAIIFWLGRISNVVGKQIIRGQQDLDAGAREVFAKLFEVALSVSIFVLLLELLGINLTALAVFGGALGVGLGFGLQSIASNFISGIIILLDRSITVDDYIQLQDGRSGTIRELNMRSAILETFDGKDIMVPNEQFITSNFVNWTHKNKKQRYPIEFTVAYDTDLDLLFKVVRDVVASHPMVLSGEELPIEERPDAEIAGFGDSGINILVEFWMEGIDDGKNRVGADLLHMIWNVLKENNIEIPYPRREVKILNPENNPQR